MNTGDKIKWLFDNCKCSVMIEQNMHRDYYEKAEDSLKNIDHEIAPDVVKKMIELDTIIRVQAYPDTPIGFYVCYHYDLDSALDYVIDGVKQSI